MGNSFQRFVSQAQHLFWDVDPWGIDPDRHASFIIERIVRFGLPADVRWMLGAYDDDTLSRVIRHSCRIDRKTASFWALHLNIPREEIRCFSMPLLTHCFN